MKQPLLRNLKFICSWNGEKFSGFQIQPHARTIEGTLNDAWALLAKVKQDSENSTKHLEETINVKIPYYDRVIGCGRLDAGVHAYRYVFNIYSYTELDTEHLIKSLNGILHSNFSAQICIYSCEDVNLDFHARFSARGKHYRYMIWHGFSEHIDFKDSAWHIRTKKSFENLESVLKIFEGTHNFNSFRASDCGAKNPIKTIRKISVTQHPDFHELYVIDIIGDGFLKNMIRNLVGAAVMVVTEKKNLPSLQERLTSANTGYNLCAPAHGLTLINVYY